MKDELFNELLESVREGGKILQGKASPSRIFVKDVSDSATHISVKRNRPKQKKAGNTIDKKATLPLHATL